MILVSLPTLFITSSAPGITNEPEWVPEGAAQYADVADNRAWVEGTGLVTLTNIFGADANTEAGWAATSFDPNALTEDGLPGPFELAFVGPLRTKVLAGSTIVISSICTSAGLGGQVLTLLSADGANGIQSDLSVGSDNVALISYGGFGGAANLNPAGIASGTPTSVNKLGLTLTPTRAEHALNGGTPQAGTFDETDWPPGELVAVALSFAEHNILTGIAVFDPLPNAAALVAPTSV